MHRQLPTQLNLKLAPRDDLKSRLAAESQSLRREFSTFSQALQIFDESMRTVLGQHLYPSVAATPKDGSWGKLLAKFLRDENFKPFRSSHEKESWQSPDSMGHLLIHCFNDIASSLKASQELKLKEEGEEIEALAVQAESAFLKMNRNTPFARVRVKKLRSQLPLYLKFAV